MDWSLTWLIVSPDKHVYRSTLTHPRPHSLIFSLDRMEMERGTHAQFRRLSRKRSMRRCNLLWPSYVWYQQAVSTATDALLSLTHSHYTRFESHTREHADERTERNGTSKEGVRWLLSIVPINWLRLKQPNASLTLFLLFTFFNSVLPTS